MGLAVAVVMVGRFVPGAAGTTTDVKSDADWILQAQLADGSIASYIDRQAVIPYMANYAAMGLARAAFWTGRSTYADASWRWLSWYMYHQDRQGFVQDYRVSNGSLEPTGDMDSTDAYAGTFLTAAWATWRFDPTRHLGRLAKLKPGISRAIGAIETTVDSDGLTWAKPSWHVKYAMDQAEVYVGLLAAGEMSWALGDSSLATRALGDARRLEAGFAALWNPETQAYDWALHENGTRQPTDWSVLYPDALQQAWVVALGLADPSRASDLMSHFDAAQPNWDQPTSTANFFDGVIYTETVAYWPVAGWAFYQVGDAERSQLASSRIRSATLAADRAWPFTTGTGGALINLEAGGLPLPAQTWQASEPGRGTSPPRLVA
jgi:hypothetical protein